jgi:predicted nucleic-acid-binding Zn-ribbon protein
MKKQVNRIDCIACGKRELSKNEIGLNRKILGREVQVFYCINCLAAELDLTVEKLLSAIENFKEQGCTLFE